MFKFKSSNRLAPESELPSAGPDTHLFLWKTYSMITRPPTISRIATGRAMIRCMKFSYVAAETRKKQEDVRREVNNCLISVYGRMI